VKRKQGKQRSNEFCFKRPSDLFVFLSLGRVLPLPLSERVHGAASLSGLGPHGRGRDQPVAHRHHQRLRPRHQAGDAPARGAGTRFIRDLSGFVRDLSRFKGHLCRFIRDLSGFIRDINRFN